MSSETRSVNQCTHVAVVNDRRLGDYIEGFVPRKPWLKIAILGALQSDRRLWPEIADRVRTENPVIRQGGDRLAAGDPIRAGRLLSDQPVEEIIAFAADYVEVERARLEEARSTVDEVLVELAETARAPKAPPVAAAVKSLRDIISTRMPALFAEKSPVGSRLIAEPDAVAPLYAEMETLLNRIETDAGQAGVQPLRTDIAAVHERVATKAPDLSKYLSNTGFFKAKTYAPQVTRPIAAHLVAFHELHLHRLQVKRMMLSSLENLMKVEPVGFLQLEKLNFTPVGYQRGELVYSLPMVPGEVTRVTHRDWTRTETEYERILLSSIETYTEEALTEKSELATSSQQERKHSSAFNASASVSGSYGPVTASASVGYSAQTAESNSRTASAKSSREITQKASSRVKQEQKTTFRVATVHEVEEQSFRELKNETDHPVRWDFHRLMKKWKIDLYRYGLRMTYDIVIPEPASYLIGRFVRLQQLKDEYDEPFKLSFTPTSITRATWTSLGAQYGVALDAPPPATTAIVANDYQTYSGRIIGRAHLEVTLPDGYHFTSARGEGMAINWGDESAGYIEPMNPFNANRLSAAPNTSSFLWTYYYDWSEPAEAEQGTVMGISVHAQGRLTEQALATWQARCYERLVDAARSQHEARRMALQHEINELEAELYRDDGLALRKIELEEIMKGVLRWVLGPDFSFYPPELPDLTLGTEGDLEYYTKEGNLRDQTEHANVLKHGELVRFLHQAIEWENVLYVLYPYFWTDTVRWEFKQRLYHPDYIHRNFLRAGAARVVLTIREGYEKAFLSFMETLDFGAMPDDYPYMTLAEEMKAMANQSYPYTPLANEPPKENLVETWFEFTPTNALDVAEGVTLEDDNLEGDDD